MMPTPKKKGKKRKSYAPRLHSYKKPKWDDKKHDDDKNGNGGGRLTQFGIPIGYEGGITV